MKPAVLMMFRDEADILGECLEHWYDLGVRDFYLIDNRSGDTSYILADCFAQEHAADTRVFLDMECATDWPGRRVINELKNRALATGFFRRMQMSFWCCRMGVIRCRTGFSRSTK